MNFREVRAQWRNAPKRVLIQQDLIRFFSNLLFKALTSLNYWRGGPKRTKASIAHLNFRAIKQLNGNNSAPLVPIFVQKWENKIVSPGPRTSLKGRLRKKEEILTLWGAKIVKSALFAIQGYFSEHHCRFKLLQFSPQIGALFSRMPIKLNFLGRNQLNKLDKLMLL